MKKIILWLIKLFNVDIPTVITEEIIVEKPIEKIVEVPIEKVVEKPIQVEKIIYKDRLICNLSEDEIIENDITIKGNVTIKGTLNVDGKLTIYKH